MLLQWRAHGRRVGLRDAYALRQGRQGTCGSIAEGPQRREQRREEDMNPLIGFALDHPEGCASCHDIVVSEAHHTRKKAG